MEPIIGETQPSSIQPHWSGIPIKSATEANSPDVISENSKSNLDALSDLSKAANDSSPDILEDVVKNARKLLEDPNWLSDENLTLLSSKILDIESI